MLSGCTFERTIMEYELAKQLKDAGVPQERTLLVWCTCQTDEDAKPHHLLRIRNTLSGYTHGEILGSTAAPTLSELVEACGEPFRGLTKRQTAQWDWWASGYANGAVACGGKTADEAAAKLWLALNAKGV